MDATICFFIILQETQTGETLKYCTISTLWNGNLLINTCGIYYAENSLSTKKCQRCLQPVKTGGSCWRLIIQTLTCAQLSLVMCKRSRNGRARILRHLGRRLPIIPRTSLDWKATGDESATSPGTYSLRFFEDLKTCCSYQCLPPSFLLVHRFTSESVCSLRDLWCCELVLVIYMLLDYYSLLN